VSLSGDQHRELRALSHRLETTQRALLLGLVELATTGDKATVAALERLTANGRLERKRGPKPGTRAG